MTFRKYTTMVLPNKDTPIFEKTPMAHDIVTFTKNLTSEYLRTGKILSLRRFQDKTTVINQIDFASQADNDAYSEAIQAAFPGGGNARETYNQDNGITVAVEYSEIS